MASVRVLFVGNSHTYYHRMPDMVAAIGASAEPPVETVESTGSGVSLAWHWDQPRTRRLIRDGKWDFVVLQERSGGPLEEPDSLREHARLLDGEVRKRGGRTVLYMTWAREDMPETQSMISAVYRELADELGAVLAPVGMAWERSLSARPHIILHDPDGRHANPAGAYLTACVFVAALLDVDTMGRPGRLSVGGDVIVDVGEQTARQLQQSAAEAVAAMQERA